MTFCGSGGGEAEERDCSLNCWQFMVKTMNCQQKKLHLHCPVPLTKVFKGDFFISSCKMKE